MDWTIERIKSELPDVPVSIANQPRVLCRLAGRKAQFASVFYGHARYEFAWESIAHALNFDRALII